MTNSPSRGTKFSVVAASACRPCPVFRRCRRPSRKASAPATPAEASGRHVRRRVVQAQLRVGADQRMAGERLHLVAQRSVVAIGPVEAEGGHPHQDQLRVDGGERLPCDPVRLDVLRQVVLDQAVGDRDQALQDVPALLPGEVHGHRQLVAAVVVEDGGAVPWSLARLIVRVAGAAVERGLDEGRRRTREVAACVAHGEVLERLDADHLRTPVRQQHRLDGCPLRPGKQLLAADHPHHGGKDGRNGGEHEIAILAREVPLATPRTRVGRVVVWPLCW